MCRGVPVSRDARAGRVLTSRNACERIAHARKASERQEREAVREAEGEGDVEGAGGEDRQLAGRLEPRWEEVPFVELAEQLLPGRDDRPEEGGRPQGRQGDRPQELKGGTAWAR